MLEEATPFLLGVLLQIGSAIGIATTTPKVLKHTTGDPTERKYEFVLDVDATQALPSLLIVFAAVTVVPGMPVALRGLIGGVGLLTAAAVARLFRKLSANDYHRHTHLGLTPLNLVMITFNLLACGAIVVNEQFLDL